MCHFERGKSGRIYLRSTLIFMIEGDRGIFYVGVREMGQRWRQTSFGNRGVRQRRKQTQTSHQQILFFSTFHHTIPKEYQQIPNILPAPIDGPLANQFGESNPRARASIRPTLRPPCRGVRELSRFLLHRFACPGVRVSRFISCQQNHFTYHTP